MSGFTKSRKSSVSQWHATLYATGWRKGTSLTVEAHFIEKPFYPCLGMGNLTLFELV